jgi:hypothetical protein
MTTQTNFNASPYFDDFDETKNYHRVLFKPTIPVQARELTQVQTILQNQIERFGNHIFKNGSVVDGCSITDLTPLSFVRLGDLNSVGSPVDTTLVLNKLAVSPTSNLSARILATKNGSAAAYPATNILYVQYINSGINGEQVFANNEALTFYNLPRTGNNTIDVVYTSNTYQSNVTTVTTGNAHGISVTSGIVYQNGFFVRTDNQVGIVSAYTTDAGNNVVGFAMNESIITADKDSSLNDNALGYSNFNAPGADRLKLNCSIITLDATTAAATVGFNPIAVYNTGQLVVKTADDPYSILGDKIAQQMYEESGNFVIQPFNVDTISHPSNNALMEVRVSPGLGYAVGKRIELLKTAYADVRRGMDTNVLKSQQITANYGSYFQVTEYAGAFDFMNYDTINLWDAPQQYITKRLWGNGGISGNNLGSARVRAVDYAGGGAPGTNTAIYNVYVFDIRMSAGKDVSKVKFLAAGNGFGGADVTSFGVVNGSAKNMFWSFGKSGLKNLRDGANNVNSQYTWRKKTASTMAVNGTIPVTISTSDAGGTDLMPYGIGTLSDDVTQDFIITLNANAVTASLTGTVSISNVSNVVTGSATTFSSNFANGEVIQVGSDQRIVTNVISNTSMQVDAPFSAVLAAQAYQKFIPKGYNIPVTHFYPGRSIAVTNTTSATINTGLNITATVGVTVHHDVLRVNTSPAKKDIRKGRFVRLDTTFNPKGPWCLGFADIHQLVGVWGNATAVYNTTGTNLTSSFVVHNGQTDSQYGLGYLYPDRGVDISATPYLTVQLDYFAANTTTGLGFFTAESYPIDDVSVSNVNAIKSTELPVYVTEAGYRVALRDVVDFRPIATNTASDQTVPASGSINPSNNLSSYVTTASGSHVPSPSKNFQSDITYYLPRKDLFYFTSSGSLKIKEGVSADTPQTPIYPDNGMPVAVVYVPPYPSMTSDQMDTAKIVNDKSYYVSRDTSNPVTTKSVTNRRYTMKDVGTLDQRLTNMEYYVALNLLEKKASDLTILDENGLNRFKNGIFADPFNSHDLGAVSNIEYRIAIDEVKSVARPFVRREVVPLTYNSVTSTNIQQTGRALTLPYTNVVLANQPYATKYRNAAPAAFKWNGSCLLFPSFDNHTDEVFTGSVGATIDLATPWQEFAASPFGTQYGDWRTTTASQTNVVETGSLAPVNQINVQLNQVLYNAAAGVNDAQNMNWVAVAAREQGVGLPAGWAIAEVVYDAQAVPNVYPLG